ncbi:FAD-linked oxidase [Streptomyces albiflavescens]|uniref:FAD-linked oxidase n=1 Tax=Streptomyces albiflavescens TaxID=1623582 RepID=A0A917Y7F7_9ACTN|nr:FAD-binding oxidoreductase [Streptomyces albiflavescens]GGN72853.1 FAD-linked oxidase [Streptomyces albiflavescens]
MRLTTSQGESVPERAVTELRQRLRGPVITEEDQEYPAAKAIWNAYFERRPGAIVRVQGAADVITAVRFAKEHGVLLAVTGGGHCFAGTGSCEGGLVVDTSALRGIRVDPGRRTVQAQPGLLQGDFDAETMHFGLAVTGSQESYIGIGGMTLGGGLGWLGRHRGLLVDNLLSADIVLADGEIRRASPQDDPDLFWAIRGGGGNFGVATSFEYKLHPQGDCLAGLLAFPVAETGAVARGLGEFNKTAPDALTTSFAFLTVEGEPAVGLGYVHADPPAGAEEAVAPLAGLGRKPLLNHVGAMPYLAVQRILDDNTVAGRRLYARSFHMDELHPEALDILGDGYASNPSPLSLVGGGLMGGVMAQLPPDATAFPHRDGYLVSVLSQWEDESEDQQNIDWTQNVYERVLPYTTGGVYVNHLGDDGPERVADAYGVNYPRLRALKTKYDPENLFRVNHNILPAD